MRYNKNYIIYNKLNIYNKILLENLGRESKTYLYYILTNYNNLPDVVVFTQEIISDHKGSDDINYLINIKNKSLKYSKSNNFFRHNDVENNINLDKEWNVRKGGYFLILFNPFLNLYYLLGIICTNIFKIINVFIK